MSKGEIALALIASAVLIIWLALIPWVLAGSPTP